MNLQMNKLEMEMNIHFVMTAKMNVEMKNVITVLILKMNQSRNEIHLEMKGV